MIISLTELYQIPGKTLTTKAPFEMADVLGYPVVKASPVSISIRHEKDRQLSLEGKAEVTLAIPCARCLKPVKTGLSVSISRMVNGQDYTDEEGDEVTFLEGDRLDLDRLTEECLLEEIPIRVLCKEDCKGLCPVCGKDLNEGPCGCEQEEAPTKMGAALLKAFQDAQKK